MIRFCLIAIALIVAAGPAGADPLPAPSVGASASGNGFDFDGSDSSSRLNDGDSPISISGSTDEWVDCGAVSTIPSAGSVCDEAAQICFPYPGGGGQTPGVDAQMHYSAHLQRQPDGSWTLVGTNCLIPNQKGQPAPDYEGAAYQQIRKLAPSPKIGIAPAGGATLVNIQTLLWLDTKPDLDLGTATLLGASVELRAHLDHVTWDFGDGESDTTHDPGRAYTEADPCDTKLCDGYWGHVYAHRGPVTISATATWTGEYRVGAGAWQAIPGQATAAPATTKLTIKQARGVLVPNPDD